MCLMADESTANSDGAVSGSAKRRGRLRVSKKLRITFAKFAVSSAAATVTGQLMLVLLFWTHWTTAGVSSAIAFVAGAVVNYFVNRRWTWGRRGRAAFRTELLPYIAVIGAYGVGTVGITKLVHMWIAPMLEDTAFRGVALNGSFLLATALLFLLKFVLLDRVFGDRGAAGNRATTSPS
ncbi:MAG: GtrA family protein [Pseudonocardiaceae bacterium]|nr:GtrA family protein [Pseudonocardiaceae bacterium]